MKRWFEANAFSVHGSLYPCFDAFDEGHGRLVRRRVFACTELDPWTTLQPGLFSSMTLTDHN